MSDDQIATALGQIMKGQEMLIQQFRDYIEAHDNRHSEDRERADVRHTKIDTTLREHEADINQAKGAKGAVVAMAAVISAIVGAAIAAMAKFFGK